ncbi:MAG: hypothetical protein WBS22_07405 [Methylocystis sp.]
MRRVQFGLAAALSLLVSSAYGGQVTLPPAQFTPEYVEASGSTGNGWTNASKPVPAAPGTYTASVSGAFGAGSATLTQELLPSPFLSASDSATATGAGPFGSTVDVSSGSILTYSVEISGPSTVTSAPINVSGYGYAKGGPDDSGATAELDLWFGKQNPNFQNYNFVARSNNSPSSSSFSANGVYLAPVNTPFEVALDVSVEGTAWVFGGENHSPVSAYAYVDAAFSLTPAEINSGLSIVTSFGVGNSPLSTPGPTPGSGLACLACLLLIGAAARARGVSAR